MPRSLPGLRIVLVNAVKSVDRIAGVNESFGVHGHAVSLRRIDVADHVAFSIEVNQRWRQLAAIGNRRIQFRLELNIGQIVRDDRTPKRYRPYQRPSR